MKSNYRKWIYFTLYCIKIMKKQISVLWRFWKWFLPLIDLEIYPMGKKRPGVLIVIKHISENSDIEVKLGEW